MLAIVVTFGFTVLGWVGSRIYQDMLPIPERIVTSDGQMVAPEGSIRRGQAVWQTLGGMEVGSIWGHGSYVAPDWTADWLHRECELILDDWARSEHAHAAFFGVYGMLGLGLTLMCLRALQADREWKEGVLAFAFWAMNGGLMAMIVLSLLPVGLLQTVASVQHGYWYASSAEFLGQGLMQTLRWLRMPGDTLFAIGAIGFVVFIFGLGVGYSLEDQGRPGAGTVDRAT
jgi:nitric oxide reductase large subunit